VTVNGQGLAGSPPGVLGGVKVFGPIGILVGPMVVVFLQTLLEILNHELAEKADSETDVKDTDQLLIFLTPYIVR